MISIKPVLIRPNIIKQLLTVFVSLRERYAF